MKDELFDGFILEFISFNFNKLLQQFDNFLNCTILIFQMVKLYFFKFLKVCGLKFGTTKYKRSVKFRNFKTKNIKITKYDLFDSFIFEFISFNFKKLLH